MFCAVVTRICPISPNGPGLFPQFGSLGIIRLFLLSAEDVSTDLKSVPNNFFPEKTDWFSRIWQQFRGLAHFRHCCHNLNCSNVADTSARRDPNQGDVRNGRDFHYSEAGVGGFSPLLPCPLLISDFVLVLAYGNGGLQFLCFIITVKFLWFVGALMQLSNILIYCLSHTLHNVFIVSQTDSDLQR